MYVYIQVHTHIYIYIYIYIFRLSHTKDLKMVLDAALLSTQHYKVRIKSKVEQSRG